MAKVCYLGAPSEVILPVNATVAERLYATRNNTGNLLIGHAVKRHISADIIADGLSVSPETVFMKPEFVNKNFDYVVIGASNFIFKNFDFGYYADFLEKIKLPITIIGVGAQSPSYNEHFEVPKGTERLLRIVSEHSTSLGVRGHFTASILNDLGIKNLRVIGCPAMYWTCQPKMHIRKKFLYARLRVAINGSANVVAHSADVDAARRVEGALANLAVQHGYTYILQNEKELMEMSLDKNAVFDPAVTRHLMGMYGVTGISEEEFISFIKLKMTAFFDVESWMREIKKKDFVVGTRFHGCLIALLAGVPSFMFVHDSRTKEMCELLKIPHADIREVDHIAINSIYKSLDFKAFESNYEYMFKEYRNFLEENGLAHTLPDTN